MLTRIELEKWLRKRYGCMRLDRVRHRYKQPAYTPMRFEGIYKLIGLMRVWDDVGFLREEIQMYSPVKGGQVYYLVEE